MTHDHVENEVDDGLEAGIHLRLLIDTSAIHSRVHHSYPSFVSHEDHHIANRVVQVVKMIWWILPLVAEI